MLDIFQAIRDVDISAVKQCLAEGIGVNQERHPAHTPLAIAVRYLFNPEKEGGDPAARFEIVKLLLSKNPDLNITIYDSPLLSYLSHTGNQKNYSLAIDIAQRIINQVDINHVDHEGNTALHHAHRIGFTPMIELLLNNNADFKIKNHAGFFPLEMVREYITNEKEYNSYIESIIYQQIYSMGDNFRPKNVDELAVIALCVDSWRIFQKLHANGCELFNRKTIFSIVYYSRITILQWWVNQYKNTPRFEPMIATLTREAIQYCRYQILELLLNYRIDFHLIIISNKTLLHLLVDAFPNPDNFNRNLQDRDFIKMQDLLLSLFPDADIKQQVASYLSEKLARIYASAIPPALTFYNRLTRDKIPIPADYNRVVSWCEVVIHQQKLAMLDNILAEYKVSPLHSKLLGELAYRAFQEANFPVLDLAIKHGFDINCNIVFSHSDHTSHPILNILIWDISSAKNPIPADFTLVREKLNYLLANKLSFTNLVNLKVHKSIFHLAASLGFTKEVGTMIDQGYPAHLPVRIQGDKITAIMLSVKNKHYETVNRLLQISHYDPSRWSVIELLSIACTNGDIPMVKLLIAHQAKAGENYQQLIWNVNSELFPLNRAANYADLIAAEEIIKILLTESAKPNIYTLQIAISRNMCNAILSALLSYFMPENLLTHTLLHKAVTSQNLFACQQLIKQQPLLLNELDNGGRTPLHYAVRPGHAAFYAYLHDQGASLTACDNQGITVTGYAICYGTADDLGCLPKNFPYSDYLKLKAEVAQLPEFAKVEETLQFNLATYCYKFIALFGSIDLACQFIVKFFPKDSRQPIHDLALFTLPLSDQHWTPSRWHPSLLEYGIGVYEYLPWAHRIEQQINNNKPLRYDALPEIIALIPYLQASADVVLAQLFKKYIIAESVFDKVLNIRQQEIENDTLPDISIDGGEIGASDFYLAKLKKRDPYGYILGELTNCCQSIGNAGETCAAHGMTSPYGGFYVVLRKGDLEKGNRLLALAQTAKDADTIANFIQSLPSKTQRPKYQKICEDIREEIIKNSLLPDITDIMILEKLSIKLQNEGEDYRSNKIIAQSWAWVSNQNALVLDSWERKHHTDDHLCHKFFEKLAELAISDYHFQRVLIGQGGQTPEIASWKLVDNPEIPKDYDHYRDSHSQYLIKSHPSYMLTLDKVDSKIEGQGCSAILITRYPSYSPAVLNAMLNTLSSSSSTAYCLPSAVMENNKLIFSSDLRNQITGMLGKFTFVILPILLETKKWSACIFQKFLLRNDKVKFHASFIDFNAGYAREVQDNIVKIFSHQELFSNIDFNITTVFNDNPVDSGHWLIEFILHINTTGKLEIKVIEDLAQVKNQHDQILLTTQYKAASKIQFWYRDKHYKKQLSNNRSSNAENCPTRHLPN